MTPEDKATPANTKPERRWGLLEQIDSAQIERLRDRFEIERAGHLRIENAIRTEKNELLAASLRQQVETLQRRVAGLEAAKEACIGICNDTRTERDALRSQVEALREYARHQEGCSAQWGDYRCRCGFAELEGRKG